MWHRDCQLKCFVPQVAKADFLPAGNHKWHVHAGAMGEGSLLCGDVSHSFRNSLLVLESSAQLFLDTEGCW